MFVQSLYLFTLSNKDKMSKYTHRRLENGTNRNLATAFLSYKYLPFMVELKPTMEDNYGVYCHLYNVFHKTKY